jgi:hypothetical protein
VESNQAIVAEQERENKVVRRSSIAASSWGTRSFRVNAHLIQQNGLSNAAKCNHDYTFR